MGLLDEILLRVNAQPAHIKRQLIEDAPRATSHMVWVPNPGPQTQAYLSEADILLFGGQAGGGKSQLLLGWGANEAQTGIIFRRELSQTDGLERDGKSIIGLRASFNGSDLEWSWADGKTMKLGGMKDADSWQGHAGRERDFVGYDEGLEFLELQVSSMFAWLRSETGRRTRMILASNPPRTAEGLWVLEWFGPWLDTAHELFPTPYGQLRWAVYVADQQGGETVWVDGPGEYEIEGETYTSRSYTFIPASLEDNPYRNTPEYRAKLQNLPEPLRSQLLKGDFGAGLQDQANQVIPTEWVRQAQARWTATPPDNVPMCAIGVDAVGGGKDQMVQAPRFDAYFADLVITPGEEIPIEKQGTVAAGLVLAQRRDGALVVVDMGGGYGGALYNHLSDNAIECMPYKGAAGTTRRSADSKLGFTNTRSAAYWGIRELLDPDQPGGSPAALPPNRRLLAGLCAPTFEVTPRGIKVEPKSKREGGVKGVVERLGWSPDEADAVVMSWWGGPRAITHAGDWIERKLSRKGRGMIGMQPKVVMGHQEARRKR